MLLASGNLDLKIGKEAVLAIVIYESLHKAVGYVSFSDANCMKS